MAARTRSAPSARPATRWSLEASSTLRNWRRRRDWPSALSGLRPPSPNQGLVHRPLTAIRNKPLTGPVSNGGDGGCQLALFVREKIVHVSESHKVSHKSSDGLRQPVTGSSERLSAQNSRYRLKALISPAPACTSWRKAPAPSARPPDRCPVEEPDGAGGAAGDLGESPERIVAQRRPVRFTAPRPRLCRQTPRRPASHPASFKLVLTTFSACPTIYATTP